MSGIYLAGVGLACSLGSDVSTSLAALGRGGVRPTLAEETGLRWPVYRLPGQDGNWLAHVDTTVRRVVAQVGAGMPRTAPLFVASSSLDIGYREHDPAFSGDVQTLADRVGAALDWRGPVFTVSTACTSALDAVQAASDLILAGDADEALVLGVELENRFTVAGFGAMRLLAPDHVRPFGAERNGLVLGQAVAALRLGGRAARWRIAGAANVVEGRNPSGTDVDAVVSMCRMALERSGLRPRDIDLIKVQATGSPVNDALEVDGLRQVFDPLPPLVSFKPAIGHTLGAAGAAELVLLMGCLETGVWPLVDYPLDEALGVSLCAHAPTAPRHIMLNFVGFGGGQASLVLEDCGA